MWFYQNLFTNDTTSIAKVIQFIISIKTKQAQRRAAEGRPRTKVILGVVFSHTMPKMDFGYSHRFS